MFLRLLILSLIALMILGAIRNALRRHFTRREPDRQQDLGVDPNTIQDAEFTDLGDTEEAHK